MSQVDAIQLLEALRTLTSEAGLVQRFHPTRPLVNEMAGENLTFVLQVALRAPRTEELHSALEKLSGLSVTQLIGVNIRKDRMGRSTLAQAVSKSLG